MEAENISEATMANYVLFDLDGTLTDPKEGITRCVQYALQKFGIEAGCNELVPFIGPPLQASFQEFYGLSEEESARAVAYYRERFSVTGLFENELYPAIPGVLAELRKRSKTLVVATSKPTVYSVRICEKFGLSQYFDHIIGSELDGTRVEKADVIREALCVLGCRADDAVMIGDRKFDILGAHECGLKAIGVRYGYASDGELEAADADVIVSQPEELLALELI